MRHIGFLIGWLTTHSLLGGLVGYLIGYLIGSMFSNSDDATSGRHSGGAFYSPQEDGRTRFIRALAVLMAHIIQADGKIMHSEMELARGLLRENFGEQGSSIGNEMLLKLFEFRKQNSETAWNRQVHETCLLLSRNMEVEQRLQLMALLCEIAKADGRVDETEVKALREIAASLQLNPGVVDQMLHLGGKSLDDAYAVLGLTKDATDDEVRKAFRKMALQYHPDRVATLGEDVKAAANRKFQEINEAKERIYKARGL